MAASAMPEGGQTKATLPDMNEPSLPSRPPRKYSAMTQETRRGLARNGLKRCLSSGLYTGLKTRGNAGKIFPVIWDAHFAIARMYLVRSQPPGKGVPLPEKCIG